MTEQEWEDKLDEVQKHSENWYNKWKQSEEKVIELEQKLKQTEKDLENKKLAIKNKKAEIKLLGKRCNQLLKDKGDLTDKIADIKANCDLAIEGRDVKIMELEKNLKLWTDTKDARETIFFQQKRKIAELEKENAELKEQLDAIDKAGEHVRQQITDAFRNKKPYWELEKENAELKEQIEKMKCCSNCNHFNKEEDFEYCWNCERHLVNSLDNLKAEEIIKDEWEIKE